MKDIIQNHGFEFSMTLAVIILVCALIGYLYIANQSEKDNLMRHRGFIEMIPSLISTLGVLGTFFGITIGLIYFDTNDLPHSIPLLLNGLKTAFFTSLAGMLGSLFLSWRVNKLFDYETAGVSESTEAAGLVVKALGKLEKQADDQATNQKVFYNTAQKLLQNIEDYNKKISVNTDTMTAALNELRLGIRQVTETQSSVASQVNELLENSVEINQTNKSVLAQTIDQANNIGEILDQTGALVSGQNNTGEKLDKLGDRLHGEVVEIEDKMSETNKLLTEKFEEFSELLKKSNTEALVEVMKKVTEEFQKQMDALISKLIKENFDQLNKSVERLNTWQQENKEMIQSLTQQYKQMAENFEKTSTSLTKVDEDTRQLVSEGGKLHQIVDLLNQVIVKDEKFIKISTDLQTTADLTKTNYEQFEAATKQLNDWVKKQRNFVDGVMVLIQKLEELDKIRDYGEQFWKETRKSMNEGVGIIKGGTEELNKQVTGLNNQFYARLSTTLAQLDNCIQALVSKAEQS